ncbi:MAG TPA: TadE/TadG family type IV pilus assembly protein [Actinomycetota bacterium]
MNRLRQSNLYRRFVACERGNVLVELGLVSTLLTTTVLGLFELGAVTSQSIRLSNAARAAVEFATKFPGDEAAIAEVAVESGNLSPETLSVVVNQFCECPGTGAANCADTCSDGSLSNMFVTIVLSQPAESFLEASGVMPDFTLESAATLRVR